jgi:hypothetical protein
MKALYVISFALTIVIGCKEPENSSDSGLGNPYWSFLDNGGITYGINAYVTDFVTFNSKMYGFWTEYDSSNNAKVHFGVYNSNAWTTLSGVNGINRLSSANAQFPKASIHNSKLYVTWIENNYSQIRVAVYNGNDSSPSWSFVDGNNTTTGLNYSATKQGYSPSLVSVNSKLYVIFCEDNTSPKIQVRAKVYNDNDSSPSWSSVDGGGVAGLNFNANLNARKPAVTAFNSKIYVSWAEQKSSTLPDDNSTIRVKVYNGDDSAPTWSFIDGNGTAGVNFDAAMAAWEPKFVTFNNKLYLGWSELAMGSGGWNNSQGKIKVYNGDDSSPSWSSVQGSIYGLNGDTDSSETLWDFAIHNSQLYVSLLDWGEGHYRIYVKSFNGNDSSPTWSILDEDSTPINCPNYGAGRGAELLSYGGLLYALSSQQCPDYYTLRLQVHD